MNAQVGFKEVQAYAQTHNVDFKTAAKQLGLSEKDAKMLEESMNGGANWGKIMDEVTFNPQKADVYKAEAKAKQEEDVKNHPEKYEPKTHKRPSGNYIVYQKDPETGKDTFKFYAADGTRMKEADFKKQEKMEDVVSFAYNPRTNSFETTKEGQTLRFTDENGKFDLAETGKSLGKIAFGMTLGLFASCSPGDDSMEVIDNSIIDVDSKTDVTVTISSADQKALIEAMNKGFEALLAKINELGLSMKEYGDQIVALLVQNNKKLDGIANELKNNGEQNNEIIKILTNINNTVSTLKDLTAGISADIKINGQSVKTQLDAILNAINSNNLNLGGLNEQMDKLQDLLKEVINNQETSLVFQENSNMNEETIINLIKGLQSADESKQLETIIDILKDIKGITQNIDNKLDAIQNTVTEIKNKFGDDGIAASLDKLIELIQANNDKADVTNELLKKLIDNGVTKADVEAIINAINKLGVDVVANMNAILDAIKAAGDNGKDIKALLDKILAKLDTMDENQKTNAKAILDAIANIKVGGGGNVDLSSLEKMMAELLELTKGNNGLLTDIDAKMDVLNVTTKAILDKIEAEAGKNDERYENVMNILNNIKGGNFDDTKLMEKLDKVLNKLDDILAAIKDHKVTVDVTGKVTCECNCGKPHEGIIGDLNDILG